MAWKTWPARMGWRSGPAISIDVSEGTERIGWLKAGSRYWNTSSSGPVVESRQVTAEAQAKPVVPDESPPNVTVLPVPWRARSMGTFVICPKSKTMAGSTPYPAMRRSWDRDPSAMRPVSWSARSADEPWKLRFWPASITTPAATARSETTMPTRSSTSVKPPAGRDRCAFTGGPPG